MARGKFAIGLAPWPDVLTEFLKAGAPLDLVILKEGTTVTPASGAFGMAVSPGHPKAGKVYLNWLLTKEAQTILSQTWGYPSMRLDVTTEGIDPVLLSQPGEKLFPDTEETVLFRTKVMSVAAEVTKGTVK